MRVRICNESGICVFLCGMVLMLKSDMIWNERYIEGDQGEEE